MAFEGTHVGLGAGLVASLLKEKFAVALSVRRRRVAVVKAVKAFECGERGVMTPDE